MGQIGDTSLSPGRRSVLLDLAHRSASIVSSGWAPYLSLCHLLATAVVMEGLAVRIAALFFFSTGGRGGSSSFSGASSVSSKQQIEWLLGQMKWI